MASRSVAPTKNLAATVVVKGGKDKLTVSGTERGDAHGQYLKSLGATWQPRSGAWWFNDTSQLATVNKYIADGKSSPKKDTMAQKTPPSVWQASPSPKKAASPSPKKVGNGKPYIEDYKTGGFVVKGTTANDEHGPHLKALGGMWQYALGGWLFKESQRSAVEAYLNPSAQVWNTPNTQQVSDALAALKKSDLLEGIPVIGQVNISFKTKPGVTRKDVLKVLRDNGAYYSARFLESQSEYENPEKIYKFPYTPADIKKLQQVMTAVSPNGVTSTMGADVMTITTKASIGELVDAIKKAGISSLSVATLSYVDNYDGVARDVDTKPITVPVEMGITSVKERDHHIQHAKLFELTNWNGDYVVVEESNKNATYLAHWRIIAQEQPETIDERLANIIKLKSFTIYALASNGEIVADLRELNIPYVRGMTRFAAIVTCVILRSPSLSKNDEYKQLIGELTPGL